MLFNAFGLNDSLIRGVEDLGFAEPSPIQKKALPPGLAGRDLLACAATGSGKTAAFVLPILQRLRTKSRGTTRALIVTPTRELALQIDTHLRELGKYTPVLGAPVYGGVGMEPQRKALQRGVDVIVATPGRLLDHLRRPYARLGGIEMLVLDEADRMLDMGFLPDIRRILACLPRKRQNFLFSATMPPAIAKLARDLLSDPVAINVEAQGKPAARITQHIYPIEPTRKSPLLLALVRRTEVKTALVFTRTKRRADRVTKFLARHGVRAGRIHGDRSQAQRTEALDGFKRGRFQILVATDVAARGLDVKDISHVINFDMPGSVEDYVHRIGRTARAEASGEAFTFVTPEDEGELRMFERRLARRLPRAVLPDLPKGPARTSERTSTRPARGPSGADRRKGAPRRRRRANQRTRHRGAKATSARVEQ